MRYWLYILVVATLMLNFFGTNWLPLWIPSMAGLFILGSIAFWILVVIESLYLALCLYDDEKNVINATLSIIVTAMFLKLFGNVDIFAYVFNHPRLTAYYIGGYVLLGVGWSMFKFGLFSNDRRKAYDEVRLRFLKYSRPGLEHKVTEETPMPYELKKDWAEIVKGKNNRYADEPIDIPNPLEHKAKITSWMIYWPWSIVAWALGDGLRWVITQIGNFYDAIYNRLRHVYQAIANLSYRGTEDDFPNPVSTKTSTSEPCGTGGDSPVITKARSRTADESDLGFGEQETSK